MTNDERRPTGLLHSADELRQLIRENPTLPLLVLAGEEANIGDYSYMCCSYIKAYKGEFLDCAQTEEHIKGALERSVKSFEDKFTSFENGGIKLLTDKSQRDDLDLEVYCNIHIDKYPAREFQTLLNTLSSVVENYEKLNHRNRKKDDAHLNKHAMHLVRLYLMCLDILEKQEICTYRENDRDFLLSIRNGAFQNEDGTYKQEFFELISDYETRLQYAKENTSLPKKPDMKRIEEFVMSVNEKSVNA